MELEDGELPAVGSAAKLFQSICYNNKHALLASIIVAGWDETKGGQVYSIPLGGTLVRQPFAIGGTLTVPHTVGVLRNIGPLIHPLLHLLWVAHTGSGSTYIYGWVDEMYRPDMSKDECVKFVQNGKHERDGHASSICCACTHLTSSFSLPACPLVSQHWHMQWHVMAHQEVSFVQW